jgi:hypothetical protein
LCGVDVVMSSLTVVVLNRSVGVIGLYVLIAMVVCPKTLSEQSEPKLERRSPVSPEPIWLLRGSDNLS